MSYFTADWLYANGQLLKEHYFYVQDGIIQEVAHLKQLNPRAFRDMVAYEDALVIPGMVNCHTHSIQSLQKGFLDDATAEESQTIDLSQYTADDYYLAALYTYSQFLRQGVTTVCDYVQLTSRDTSIFDAHVQAAEELGLRVVLARVMADQQPGASASYPWALPTTHCPIESAEEALEHTRDLMEQYRKHELIRVMPAPYGLMHSSPALLKGTAKLVEATNSAYHIQVAQNRAERDWCLNTHATTPVQYLNKLGVLSHRSLCIHGLWLDDQDIQTLITSGASVVDTPSNNLAYGHGSLRLKALLDNNVPVSFGTGGAWRNGKSSILEEMRVACLIQKLTDLSPQSLTAETVFKLGSRQAGLNLNLPIGAIAPGNKADFSVIDLNDLSMQPNPAQQAIKHLVYSIRPSAISAVYVAGQRLFDTGDFLSISEYDLVTKLADRHQVSLASTT